MGAGAANKYIYKNVWFIALQGAMVITAIGVMIKSRLFSRKLYGAVTLHIALIAILVGALVTHIWGYEGYLHLREGQSSEHMKLMSSDRQQVRSDYKLPFTLTLDDFVLERYPGSQSPSSYESFLRVTHGTESRVEHIYMNRVLDLEGYRIFQASYDPDEKGSVLTISYDPWGTGITYLGYLLLSLGFIILLFEKNSYFSRRGRGLGELHKKMGTMAVLAAMLLSPHFAHANATDYAIPADFAKAFSRLQVQSSTGRMEPVDTYSEQLLRKITKKSSFKGLNGNQVLLGIIAYPEVWSQEKLFKTSNQEVASMLKVGVNEQFSLYQLFDENYILGKHVEEIYTKDASSRSKTDKEILKIDERANILYGLQQGMFLSLFPIFESPTHKWLSSGDDLSELGEEDKMFVSKIMLALVQEMQAGEVTGDWSGAYELLEMIQLYQEKRSSGEILQSERQINIELLYNKFPIFSYSAFSYMTLGLILLALSITYLNKRRKWTLWALRGSILTVLLIFVAHTVALAARGYISGRAPWANGYESMIFVAWSGVLAGTLFIRRSHLTFAMATLLGGIVLLVAHLNFLDPEITPLVPVLKSYWLMFHVAIITSSYGFFGMSFLLSSLNLSISAFGKDNEHSRSTLKELYIISEMSQTIGLALLSIGTFLGAIWANESWGRYWGWDPKETWALISMLVYALVLHARFIPRLNNSFAFNTLTIYALGSILMTYFGVNYFLGGLHSYAGGDTPPALWGIAAIYVVLTAIVIAAWRKQRDTN